MRYKKYKKRSSRVIKMRFQSFFDIATQADNMQIISVNAGGPNVLKRLLPFFMAYKYYKLGSVSFKLIPASTLPVDPTGLSYEAGENTVDPRDQLTPGMCRITNGEDVLEDLTGLSGDGQRELYDNMILDPRWFKWMLQSGVKRYASPRFWQVGQLHQDKWPGATANLPSISSVGNPQGTMHYVISDKDAVGRVIDDGSGSSPRGLFQTGMRGRLGWMPTDGLQAVCYASETTDRFPFMAAIPEIELFKILTPPMRKTNYYYRAFITETVYFREPIVMNVNGRRPIDVFHAVQLPLVTSPTTSQTYTDASIKALTGGNDGSD